MKPFRKNVAIAIDGGGIRGAIVTRALSILEEHLGLPIHTVTRLAAGTSTGAIISAGIGAGLSAMQIHALYLELGKEIFKRTWRTALWPLTRYRYPQEPLAAALRAHLGESTMEDLWNRPEPMDVVITAFDILENRSRFIKPFKQEYRDLPVADAVLASSSVPTYFPVVAGRYVDGGVGSYANPCYLAAYEILHCLKWDLSDTTLISLGTGRDPQSIKPGQPERFFAWNWLAPMFNAFLSSADDQQVHLVETFFEKLDFRRFQVELEEKIEMDAPRSVPKLVRYGNRMGEMILNDEYDPAMGVKPEQILRSRLGA
ncbi:MAG: patatin-like phospholipase family protein [Anaerolineales bacterium]|nr:patatin-like phospholipase family protein [Anaerolineales bacterium]